MEPPKLEKDLTRGPSERHAVAPQSTTNIMRSCLQLRSEDLLQGQEPAANIDSWRDAAAVFAEHQAGNSALRADSPDALPVISISEMCGSVHKYYCDL